jgi:hypothetical protein
VLSRSDLEWLAFAVIAAIACRFVAIDDTPIDRHLPFVIVLIAVCGYVAARWAAAIQMSIVLLLVAAMFLPDERVRLLTYGFIVAAAFAGSVAPAASPAGPPAAGPAAKQPASGRRYLVLTMAGVLLLRWIPFADVLLWRELVVVMGAATVLVAYRDRTPLAIAAALAVAVVTPVFPGRMLLFPFFVAALIAVRVPWLGFAFIAAAYYARYSIAILCVVTAIALFASPVSRTWLRVPTYAAAIALLALWPWSGLVARAFPRFLIASPPPEGEQPVWVALGRGQSVSIDAPPHKHAVAITASGANAASMPEGRVMGSVEVLGRTGDIIRRQIRIGDIADFGFMRREHFFASRNPPPRHPIDDVKGYGQAAWLHTAGWMVIGSPDEIASLHFSAARDLPPAVRLQIEAVDFE